VRALQANPEDPFSHLSYAKFLCLCQSFEKAEDHFLESLILEPNSEKGLLAYSEFLLANRQQQMESAMFRSRAQHVRQFMITKGKQAWTEKRLLNQTLIIPKDLTQSTTNK
jgi:hypothetical protein